MFCLYEKRLVKFTFHAYFRRKQVRKSSLSLKMTFSFDPLSCVLILFKSNGSLLHFFQILSFYLVNSSLLYPIRVIVYETRVGDRSYFRVSSDITTVDLFNPVRS